MRWSSAPSHWYTHWGLVGGPGVCDTIRAPWHYGEINSPELESAKQRVQPEKAGTGPMTALTAWERQDIVPLEREIRPARVEKCRKCEIMNFYHKCIYCDTVFVVKTKLELHTGVLDKGNTACE